VVNSPAIFAGNNNTAEDAAFNKDKTVSKTKKTGRKKKNETARDTIFIRGIADNKTVAIPLEGADHITVSVTADSLRVQPGKKKKASRPSSKYGGHVVTRSELEKTGEMNLLRAVGMRVPGVRYTGGNLLIRGGATTFNSSNTPLYIVDGVESSYVSHLLVTEVEYVEVLKDASTSMFGMRGGNGVVVINRRK
jgi:TonB-dependent SusC/RagA subfamily outer membrane receptor